MIPYRLQLYKPALSACSEVPLASVIDNPSKPLLSPVIAGGLRSPSQIGLSLSSQKADCCFLQVLSIGETIQEVSDSGFLGPVPTLQIQLLVDDSLLQVNLTSD